MNRVRLLSLLGLAGALFVSAAAHAQPPKPVGAPVPPLAVEPLPVLPKSAGAFVTLKVSDLLAQPDLKPMLEQLAKQPDALAGVTELIGVSPLELERVTLFWPRGLANGPGDPILVVTTREPYNEARVLKALRARPVYEDDFRGHRHGEFDPTAPVAHQFEPGAKAAPQPQGKAPELLGPASVPKGGGGAPPSPVPPIPPKEDTTEDLCGAGDGGPSEPLYYEPHRGGFEALFLIDDRTLLFLPAARRSEFAGMALLAAALKKSASGPLADAIAGAGKHTFAAGVSLAPIFRQFERRMPAELVPYTALLAARTGVVTGDLLQGAKLKLALQFDDAAAAKRAAPVLEEGIATVAEKFAGFAAEMKDSRRPFESSAAPVVSALVTALKKSAVKATDTTVTATAEMETGPVLAKALGDLLQAVHSRKKAEQRTNNLKQIGLALHSYHDVNGRFPANVYGPKGELLLSWRVQLLPFLEQDNLYKQFKMDEAWDGPNNKKLIEQMPKVFQAPDRAAPKGTTYYQGFVGPDPRKGAPPKAFVGSPWLREGEKNGVRIVEIHDGTSNTLAVIEAGRGVAWSKPEDLPFGGPVPPLGEKGWDRTPALRFDGSVTLFPTDLPAEVFWHYVTINGGEVTEDLDERRGPGGGRADRPGANDSTIPRAEGFGKPPPGPNPPTSPK